MQLVSKFTCKINIERNGLRILGPKLQNSLFIISMHDCGKFLTISITAKNTSCPLPNSAYIPKLFSNKNVNKLQKQFLDQGKLTIILLNYDSTAKDYSVMMNPSIQTCIYISEAPVEALKHFWFSLVQGPNKRDIIEVMEEREKIRTKPKFNVWQKLNLDVVRVIFSFLNDKIGALNLVNRSWCMMISELTRKVTFKYTKDLSGEVIARIIKRNPFLTDISMEGCRNFSICHMKKANTLPIKRVLHLNLQGCRKINSECLFKMILCCHSLISLNLIDTAVDDSFFADLNPSIHLKELKELRIGNICEIGVSHLVSKYSSLKSLEIHPALLTGKMMQNIVNLENLLNLKIYYTEISKVSDIIPKCHLNSLEILQLGLPHSTSTALPFWLSLKDQNYYHIGCNLPKDSMYFLFPSWPSLKSATLTEYCEIPSTINYLVLYYSEDLDDEIYNRTDFKFLSSLKKCKLLLKSLEVYLTRRITDYFKSNYPQCSLVLNSY